VVGIVEGLYQLAISCHLQTLETAALSFHSALIPKTPGILFHYSFACVDWSAHTHAKLW